MTEKKRIDIIRRLTENGLSCAKIAPYAKCSAGKVNTVQQSLGIQRARGGQIERPSREEILACDGMTSAEICAHFSRGHDTVSKWLRYYEIARAGCGPRLGQLIDVIELRAWAGLGLTGAQISLKIGTEEIVVCRVAHCAGIVLPASDQPTAAARTKRHRSRADCTRPIAGSFTPYAVKRALAKLEGWA